jgi:hypothetical protein
MLKLSKVLYVLHNIDVFNCNHILPEVAKKIPCFCRE